MRLKSAVIAATALAGPANSGCNREGGTYAVLDDAAFVEVVIMVVIHGALPSYVQTLLLTAVVPTDLDADAVDPFHCQIIAKIIRQVAQHPTDSVGVVVVAATSMINSVSS